MLNRATLGFDFGIIFKLIEQFYFRCILISYYLDQVWDYLLVDLEYLSVILKFRKDYQKKLQRYSGEDDALSGDDRNNLQKRDSCFSVKLWVVGYRHEELKIGCVQSELIWAWLKDTAYIPLQNIVLLLKVYHDLLKKGLTQNGDGNIWMVFEELNKVFEKSLSYLNA